MKSTLFLLFFISSYFTTKAQIQRPLLNKTTTKPVSAPSVYSISNIKAIIHTGNDNKEANAFFLFHITENYGGWGNGRDLFTQQDQSGRYELKVNSVAEIPMQRFNNTPADAFTLPNLETKGIRFRISYLPGFFSDAWKIDAVTIVLEFKDQYGRLHPVSPLRTIRFNNSAGLLTNAKGFMTGITDGFLTPQPVTITDK